MKCALLPTYLTNSREFEQIIEKEYGFRYSFHHATGLHKGCNLELFADGTFPTQPLKSKASKVRSGDRQNDPKLLLNVLVSDRKIQPGRYVILTVGAIEKP